MIPREELEDRSGLSSTHSAAPFPGALLPEELWRIIQRSCWSCYVSASLQHLD